jgi:hypothetical protein
MGLARLNDGRASPACAGLVDVTRLAEPRRDCEFVYRSVLRLGGRKPGDSPKAPWVSGSRSSMPLEAPTLIASVGSSSAKGRPFVKPPRSSV